MSTIPEDLITAKAAANLLAVHVATVYRLVRSGRLRGWKRYGGRLRVSRAEVLGLLVPVQVSAAGEVPPAAREDEEAAAQAMARMAARRQGPR